MGKDMGIKERKESHNQGRFGWPSIDGRILRQRNSTLEKTKKNQLGANRVDYDEIDYKLDREVFATG